MRDTLSNVASIIQLRNDMKLIVEVDKVSSLFQSWDMWVEGLFKYLPHELHRPSIKAIMDEYEHSLDESEGAFNHKGSLCVSQCVSIQCRLQRTLLPEASTCPTCTTGESIHGY